MGREPARNHTTDELGPTLSAALEDGIIAELRSTCKHLTLTGSAMAI